MLIKLDMLSVFQPWDPLRICLVGKTYPPQFYNFIDNSNVRDILETIALDTQEDLDYLQRKLESFHVDVIRPTIQNSCEFYKRGDRYFPPPLTPRDDICVIDNRVFMPRPDDLYHWRLLEQTDWKQQPPRTHDDWNSLPNHIKSKFSQFMNINRVEDLYYRDYSAFCNVEKLANMHGNEIIYDQKIDSAMICRVGKDLVSGLWPNQNQEQLLDKLSKQFSDYRVHIVDTQGHLDGVFTVLCEGLILANEDLEDSVFEKHFPGWRVIKIKNNSSNLFRHYEKLKIKNQGKWLVKGQENNDEFIDFVETYISNWLGFVEETSVGVNVLMVDRNNMFCTIEDPELFKILESYKITAHVIPFRHYNFWDSGIHCLTVDLHRDGQCRDLFLDAQTYQ